MLRGGSEALPSSFPVAGPDVFFFFCIILSGNYRDREAEEKAQSLESGGSGFKSHLYHSYICALD